MSFTPQAEIEQKAITFNFPKLEKFYNPMLGNFQFSKYEMKVHIVDIVQWMEYFPEYMIIHQVHEDHNGQNYFLTDFMN
jgi:hypothetical protein